MPDNESPFWYVSFILGLVVTTIWGISTGYKEGWVAAADIPVAFKIAGPPILVLLGRFTYIYFHRKPQSVKKKPVRHKPIRTVPRRRRPRGKTA